MSPACGFVNNTAVPDLGIGSAIAIWGFRSCARGGADHPLVIDGYNTAFGQDASAVLANTVSFAEKLGEKSRRRIGLAMPGCPRITADEMSIVGALAAAQARDDELLAGHVTWLLAGNCDRELADTVVRLADDFSRYGLQINVQTPPPSSLALDS